MPETHVPGEPAALGKGVFSRPSTQLGRWSVALAGAFVLMIINSAVFMRLSGDVPWQATLLPFYGITMILCALAAGIVALVAVIRQHERSWLVWLSLLVGLFVVVLLLGEFLFPH